MISIAARVAILAGGLTAGAAVTVVEGYRFTGGPINDISVDGGVTAKWLTVVNGPTALNGSTTVDGGLTVQGPARAATAVVTGELYSGSAVLDGGLTANGAARLNAGATVVGQTYLAGGTTVDGGLTVQGPARAATAVVTGELYSGSAVIDGGLTANGAALLNAGATVVGQTYLAGGTTVDGGLTVQGPARAATAVVTGELYSGSAVIDGGLLAGNAAFGQLGVDGGPTELLRYNVVTATTPGLTIRNPTPATAGVPRQYAPVLWLCGSNWSGSAAKEACGQINVTPTANTTVYFQLKLEKQDSTYVNVLSATIDTSAGTVTTYEGTTGSDTFYVRSAIKSDTGSVWISDSAIIDDYLYSSTGRLTLQDVWGTTETSSVIADNSTPATPATLTLAPTTSYHAITCNDADGCEVTLSETGATSGNELIVCNNSANDVTILRSAGVAELEGTTNQVLHANGNDCLRLIYGNSTWRQVGQVAHNHL